MRKHEKAEFVCEICGSNFKYKSNLTKHLRKGKCRREEKAEIDLESEAKIARKQFVEITKNFGKSLVALEDVKEEEEEEERSGKNF